MKTNGTHEVIARIVGLGLVLVAFLATVFSSSIAGRAQAGATSPAVPAATPAMAAPAGQGAHSAAPSERQPKGTQEGIKVHGHWTIEVMNPDGTLVNHREFENSLYPAIGAQFLGSILYGQVTPSGWVIGLQDTTGAYGILIYQNTPAYSSCPTSTTLSCSNTLTVTGPSAYGLGPAPPLTFTGSSIVPSGFPAAIGKVNLSGLSCSPSVSPVTCATISATSPNFYGSTPFTARQLDGLNGDPPAVSVTPGQTVAVTVVISFM